MSNGPNINPLNALIKRQESASTVGRGSAEAQSRGNVYFKEQKDKLEQYLAELQGKSSKGSMLGSVVGYVVGFLASGGNPKVASVLASLGSKGGSSMAMGGVDPKTQAFQTQQSTGKSQLDAMATQKALEYGLGAYQLSGGDFSDLFEEKLDPTDVAMGEGVSFGLDNTKILDNLMNEIDTSSSNNLSLTGMSSGRSFFNQSNKQPYYKIGR